MTYLSYAIELVLGVTFLVSGVGKFRRLPKFERDLVAYRILPSGGVRPLSIGLPAVEVAVGAALLAGVIEAVALGVGAVLLLAFAAGMGLNLARGRRIDCGCSGRSQRINWGLVCRNATLAALAVVAFAVVRPASGLRELAGAGAISRADLAATTGCLVLFAVEMRLALTVAGVYRRVVRQRLPQVLGSV